MGSNEAQRSGSQPPSSAQRPAGLTKDGSWQIGVRRTLPFPSETAWKILLSPEGLSVWLGKGAGFAIRQGQRFQLADGSRGEIRVFKPGSHLRLRIHPPDWERASTIQVRVLPDRERCVIAFHEEHLPSGEARQARRAHYLAAIEIVKKIGSGGEPG